MTRMTNARRTLANILARETRFRESGHWPNWNRQDLPDGAPGASANSWMREARRVAENGVFVVLIREVDAGPFGKLQHAMIRTASEATDITWAEKQRIKDEVFGRERTAMEVYPPQSELIDDANMYHLWVFPAGHLLPFTLAKRGAA